ncbi:MAG: hypothetical protein ACXAC2_11255, partial [Candidatus Kariarchaeaceae archaeon]|jgi:hypothetical protein
VNIVGNITNTPGEFISSTIYLEYESTPGVWIILENVTSDNFDFTLDNLSAGSYNYRIRIDESANWISVIQPITVSVGQSNAAISRGELPLSFDIEYHQSYDLSVYVLKDDLSSISNASFCIHVDA